MGFPPSRGLACAAASRTLAQQHVVHDVESGIEIAIAGALQGALEPELDETVDRGPDHGGELHGGNVGMESLRLRRLDQLAQLAERRGARLAVLGVRRV